MNISMPPKVRAVFDQQMRRGGFDNASEYVRYLVRAEEERMAPEWLEDLIEEGLRSPMVPMDDRWLAERKRKLREHLAARRRRAG
jgi:putative addiction module CopG family antidote